jgi:hypothetical protein
MRATVACAKNPFLHVPSKSIIFGVKNLAVWPCRKQLILERERDQFCELAGVLRGVLTLANFNRDAPFLEQQFRYVAPIFGCTRTISSIRAITHTSQA